MSEHDAGVASSATDQPEPVPAADAAFLSDDMAAYRAARAAERLGTPLEPSPAASAAAKPVTQAAETAASSSPASEPGKASGHKGNAETRKAELEAEIQSLLKQRADLRRETATPAPEPSPTNAPPASHPASGTEDREPQLEEFEGQPDKYPDPFTAWMDARSEWRAERVVERKLQEARAVEAQAKRTSELESRAKAFRHRLDEAFAGDPGLRERILLDRFDVVPSSAVPPGEPVTPSNDLAEALLESDRPADLMRHLSESPKVFAQLLASPDPRTFWRRLGQIEGEMRTPARPAPKTITDAPAPPATVGTRTEAGDELEAAVRSDDVLAYREAKLRRARAALR